MVYYICVQEYTTIYNITCDTKTGLYTNSVSRTRANVRAEQPIEQNICSAEHEHEHEHGPEEACGKCLGNMWEVRGKLFWKWLGGAELSPNTCKTLP